MVFVQGRALPSLADMLAFEAKAALFRGRRHVREFLSRDRVVRHALAATLADAPVLVCVSSPLWAPLAGEKDRALTAGKIHNLRAALRGLDGVEVPAGRVLSFWKQVGRATRRRGFVAGRELREGCLIANVGGGLCQLSNALYEAAERAGFTILERHGHSRVVPGSRAQLGRDATVFWNYVDLRFVSDHAFRIEARLTRHRLEVAFRGTRLADMVPAPWHEPPSPAAAHDCTSCGEVRCRRNNPDGPGQVPTAWLVDAGPPEFAALFAGRAGPADALILSTRLGRRRGFARNLAGTERTADIAALRRWLAARAKGQGAARQARLLAADVRLAAAMASRLSYLHTHLVVSQALLPHLWRLGALQGRTFEVLMERLPLHCIHEGLDRYANPRDDPPAPEEIVAAEREALDEAALLHARSGTIADLYPSKTNRLDGAPARY